jgi:hypothetical protein
MRFPVAAKMALQSAGGTGGTPGSPTPPDWRIHRAPPRCAAACLMAARMRV